MAERSDKGKGVERGEEEEARGEEETARKEVDIVQGEGECARREERSPRGDEEEQGVGEEAEQGEDEAANIQVDFDAPEADESFGDDALSTKSLHTAITKFVYENGRRYHSYRQGAYW